ncbi:hypothetical protein N8I74_12815 [Chitiniphilus purpureus]|uniref:Uncharacterized protein n=1 Tax=Chitiniphilus purpureus TaxID=2981137 RepID=A0ABY6DKH7_9NEIS|nr:hypothetical protein [Chitiniphilus sp. CD1]UXY14198.1 hypothetical protein N8I74_12815 [Chitiniphilus sp. CD1]
MISYHDRLPPPDENTAVEDDKLSCIERGTLGELLRRIARYLVLR